MSRGWPAHDIETDRAQRKADADREERLRDVVTAETDEGRECQHHQGELLGRPECQRHRGKRRGKAGEEKHRDGAADERGGCGGNERLIRLAGKREGRPSKVVATAVEAPGIPQP